MLYLSTAIVAVSHSVKNMLRLFRPDSLELSHQKIVFFVTVCKSFFMPRYDKALAFMRFLRVKQSWIALA